MKISWLGHSCFLLESDQGTKIITDPYESGSYDGAVGYDPVNIQPDIVTVSHQHPDHNYTSDFKTARIIDEPGSKNIKDIIIQGIKSFHDNTGGKERGDNIIFVFELEGLKVAHFGDLGTKDIDFDLLKGLDIVMIPIGGTFTLDYEQASEVISKLNPGITIPMHFKTPKLGFGIDKKDNFLSGKDFEQKEDLIVSPETIKDLKKIVVLNYKR